MTKKNKPDEYAQALNIARAIDPDWKEVERLIRAAIKRGDVRAKYALATWYLNDNPAIATDESSGVSILLELEDSNLAEALYDLAVAHDLGRGVPQDEYRAFSLYMRAGLLGDKEACGQVSQFYAEGKTVPFDQRLADAWGERSKLDEDLISPSYRVRIDSALK